MTARISNTSDDHGDGQMVETTPPDWAIEQAVHRIGMSDNYDWSVKVVRRDCESGWAKAVLLAASFIAEHEEKPVDPLLIEARKVVENYAAVGGYTAWAKAVANAESDNGSEVRIALAALKRGIEIGGAK